MMTSTEDIDMVLATYRLPIELTRPASSSLQGEEPRMTAMLCGMIPMGQWDDVVCPMMLRCRLVIPAHRDPFAYDAWRVN
jgi:hypothetical protein